MLKKLTDKIEKYFLQKFVMMDRELFNDPNRGERAETNIGGFGRRVAEYDGEKAKRARDSDNDRTQKKITFEVVKKAEGKIEYLLSHAFLFSKFAYLHYPNIV